MNNISLTVPQACRLSCSICSAPQRLSDINPSVKSQDDGIPTVMEEEEYTTESTTTSSSSTTTTTTTTTFEQNIIFSRSEKCFDKRDDCSMQKEYGFCEIFNEKYPYDCIKTCHPDCASDS